MPDPTTQLFQSPLGLGQLEIRRPASQYRIEFLNSIGQTPLSRAVEHFTDTLLQPLQAARRNPSFRGFMPSQAIAQKLPQSLTQGILHTISSLASRLPGTTGLGFQPSMAGSESGVGRLPDSMPQNLCDLAKLTWQHPPTSPSCLYLKPWVRDGRMGMRNRSITVSVTATLV